MPTKLKLTILGRTAYFVVSGLKSVNRCFIVVILQNNYYSVNGNWNLMKQMSKKINKLFTVQVGPY